MLKHLRFPFIICREYNAILQSVNKIWLSTPKLAKLSILNQLENARNIQGQSSIASFFENVFISKWKLEKHFEFLLPN